MPSTYLLGEEKKVHSLPSRKREHKRRSWSWWCRKRTGERGRRVSSGETWNLVALGVHAVLVGNIVASLDGPRSSIAGIGTNRTTCKQAGSGAGSRAWSRMAEGCADRPAYCGSESGAGNSPGYRAVLRRFVVGKSQPVAPRSDGIWIPRSRIDRRACRARASPQHSGLRGQLSTTCEKN